MAALLRPNKHDWYGTMSALWPDQFQAPQHTKHDNHCSNDIHHRNNNNGTEEQVLHVVENPTKSSNILAKSSDLQGTPALLVAQVAG